MKKDSFVKGAIITYLAMLFIKVLGALYVIPFYSIIGEEGGVLYNYAYQIYNLFYGISTSGIPVALSIVLSEYISLGKIKTQEKTYKVTNKLIMCISFSLFLVLFIFAGPIGSFFISGLEGTTSIENIKLVIRSISLCLLIIPFLSIIRGYLQAHKYVSISSYSQVIEQIVRILLVLGNSYVLIKVFHFDVVYGVAASLLGALFGGLVAYIYLSTKKKKVPISREKADPNEKVLSTKEIIKKVISCSIPMTLIAILGDLYNIVDIKLIIIGLTKVGYESSKSEIIASILSTWAPKICVIIMAIATSMISSIIPHIVSYFTKKEYDKVNDKIDLSLKTMLLFSVPLCIGVCFLSEPLYYVFYGQSETGGTILLITAIVNLVCCFNTILSTILQCMKKFKKIYLNTFAGLILNVILDIPMIYLLDYLGLPPYVGTSIASLIGYSFSSILSVFALKKELKYSFKNVKKYLLKLGIPVLSLTGVLVILRNVLVINLEFSYAKILIFMMIYALIGGIIYLILTYKMKLTYEVLGFDVKEKIMSKFKKNR